MKKVIIIGGPTGIGKSDMAVRLALRYDKSFIIGADSMQIYKGMDVGTGKVTEKEKCGIEHTMIDILCPNELYSVQNYVEDAKAIINKAHNDGKLPIIVGGTGLYINAIINEQNFAGAKPNPAIRAKYNEIAFKNGNKYLHDMLRAVDETSADNISVNDTKRIVRAMEIYEQKSKKKSETVTSKKSEYDIKFFVLETDRTQLYDRINLRVEKMFDLGFVDEVIGLKNFWDCRSMEAIGYKEIINALKNDDNPLLTKDSIKQNTRRYAKRQIAFFKWISAQKNYVSGDFYKNIVSVCDEWLQER